jgi:hypothetical protein
MYFLISVAWIKVASVKSDSFALVQSANSVPSS